MRKEHTYYVVVNSAGEYLDRYGYCPPTFDSNIAVADFFNSLEDAQVYANDSNYYGRAARVKKVTIIEEEDTE